MKRYSQILDKNLDGKLQAKMYVNDTGEWVKYDDVKGMLEYKDQLQGMKLESESCNCLETLAGKVSDWWICPAHGYKRL